MRARLPVLLGVVLLAGCASPIGRDGEPISLGQAFCESIPGRRCCREHPPPPPQPYCTGSLGVADCWRDPNLLPNHPPDLADQPVSTAPSCS